MATVEIIAALIGILAGGVTLVQVTYWVFKKNAERIDRFKSIERYGLVILNQIKEAKFEPDFVLGLGRSGAFLGGWLAGNINSLPIEVIDRMHQDESTGNMVFPDLDRKFKLLLNIYGPTARVLVVEGACTRGGTFLNFEQYRKTVAPNWQCQYAVLYELDTSAFQCEYVGKYLEKAPIKYPWHATKDYKSYLRATPKTRNQALRR